MQRYIPSALRLICLRQAADAASTSSLTSLASFTAALQVMDSLFCTSNLVELMPSQDLDSQYYLQALPPASAASQLPSMLLRALSGRHASTSAPATEFTSLNNLSDNPGATHYVRLPVNPFSTQSRYFDAAHAQCLLCCLSKWWSFCSKGMV